MTPENSMVKELIVIQKVCCGNKQGLAMPRGEQNAPPADKPTHVARSFWKWLKDTLNRLGCAKGKNSCT